MANQALDGMRPKAVFAVTNIQAKSGFPSNYVSCARSRFHRTNGRYQPRNGFCFPLHSSNPFRRTGDRIEPQIHRSRPCMVRTAHKSNLYTALTSDRVDHCKRQSQVIEHWPLLDMKFKEAHCIIRKAGLPDVGWVESEVGDRSAYRDSVSILRVQQILIESSHQRAAADKWSAKPKALFLREADDFDCVRKSPSAQSL